MGTAASTERLLRLVALPNQPARATMGTRSGDSPVPGAVPHATLVPAAHLTRGAASAAPPASGTIVLAVRDLTGEPRLVRGGDTIERIK